MRSRRLLAVLTTIALIVPGFADAKPHQQARHRTHVVPKLPAGFRPAVLRTGEAHRFIVQMRAPASITRATGAADAASVRKARASQARAIRLVHDLGGHVTNRFSLLVNGFAAEMSADDAARVARLRSVASVRPAGIVRPGLTSSVPFIGAPAVWTDLHARGEGVTVAVIDSGVDYTHEDFGGSGSVDEYEANDPTVIEPGSFPTTKVVGGWDFVGDLGYDPQDPANNTPSPDPDPLDVIAQGGGHGTHVAGICCGSGVNGSVGEGVAPEAEVFALKVFDVAGTPTDMLIVAMERAADPNQDGNTNDAVDVINMSIGSPYDVEPLLDAAVLAATQAGIVVAISAGNEGNQPSGGSPYIVGGPGNAPAGIGVAATIDQFEAAIISTEPVIDFPDAGLIAIQDWGGDLTEDVVAPVVDARGFATPVDASGEPGSADRALCDATPPGLPFSGSIVLVFKGPFADGDCLADDKALHAQEAGATAVILWDGFGGLPSQFSTGTSAALVTIPVVSLSGNDSAALAAVISPDAPADYNTATVTATLHADPVVIPGYEDVITDFTSEGPTRITSALKPDVSAPGFGIASAAAGTGSDSVAFSGTSMAAPHIAGVAALLVQLHPEWTPEDVKAAIMNHATQDLRALDGTTPLSATVIGAGRVEAFPSASTQVLAEPASLSFGLQGASRTTWLTRSFRVKNLDHVPHTYRAQALVRFSDFTEGFAHVELSTGGYSFGEERTFTVGPRRSSWIRVRLVLDPSAVSSAEQQFGWYYFNPNVDGNILLDDLTSGESLHVPWHVSGLATAKTKVGQRRLDLRHHSRRLFVSERGVGTSYADLYLLGTTSPRTTGGEEDIAAVGARSFTGSSIDGIPSGVPGGVDELVGITWLQFLTNTDEPSEPIEFGIATHGIRSTTETTEVDILIDLGADGVFADPDLEADVMAVKLSGPGGLVCVFDLPSTFEACDASYFADYSNFNSDVTGVVMDASAIGLSDAVHTLSYSVSVCDVSFDPDSEPGPTCDSVGELEPGTGTYDLGFDATQPSLSFSAITCGGFWGGASCGPSSPVTVGIGSAQPGDDPSILALFPNNTPGDQSAIVRTRT